MSIKGLKLQELTSWTAGVPNILHENRGIPDRAVGPTLRKKDNSPVPQATASNSFPRDMSETERARSAPFLWERTTTMMRRRDVIGKDSGSPSVKPGEGSSELFQVTMLRALMLPPRCRDVFVLKQIHGYTPAEVAAVLGMSTGDVRKHLRRALREMQPD
jgi:DNA-binding CsgD family transcriptional regulator